MSFPPKRAQSPISPAERTQLARVLFDRARAGRAFDILDAGPCAALHLPVADSVPRCCRVIRQVAGLVVRAERLAHDPEWLFFLCVSNPITQEQEVVLFVTYPRFTVQSFQHGSWQNALVPGSYVPPSAEDDCDPRSAQATRWAAP